MKHLILAGLIFLFGWDHCAANHNTGVCTATNYQSSYSLKYGVRLYYYSQGYTYGCGFWGWSRCSASRTRSAYQSYSYSQNTGYYYQQEYCCPGYSGTVYGTGCKPLCNPECVHGTCTDPYTCTCDPGWQGTLCEADVPECFINNGGCEHGCMEMSGSYTCYCEEGYRLNHDNHSCEDIDECAEGIVKVGNKTEIEIKLEEQSDGSGSADSVAWCHQVCNNTIGAYICDCLDGYDLDFDDNSTCTDIDECALDNGFCEHSCHNTIGSYYCTCNDGFILLEDGKGCTDHDECPSDCDQHCHNTHGGYYCSCDNGYRLQGLFSCLDIDECLENIAGCSDTCHNTIGSFYCTCFDGYELEFEKGTECLDINECKFDNGGCTDLCTNTPGSYTCQCEDGFALAVDKHSCYGEPCPYLAEPSHGSIVCTGPQITGESCSFQCNPGYYLTGSNSRSCQPNHKWSGGNAMCLPMKCPQLNAPFNGFVVSPCNEEFQSNCTIICDKGYHVTNTTNEHHWIQSCVLNSVNQGVEWAASQSCTETPPCSGNPCGPGTCSVTDGGEMQCDCEGTLRVGERCDTSYIRVAPVELLTVNRTYDVLITSALPSDYVLSITSSDNSKLTPNPQNLILHESLEQSSTSYTLNTKYSGIYRVQYRIKSDSVNILNPEDTIALVSSTKGTGLDTSSYFEMLGLKDGLLESGCCSQMVSSLQPNCFSDLHFSSSCEWTSSDGNQYSSKGIIFVKNRAISLPLSVAGINISTQDSLQLSLLTNDISTVPTECGSCRSNQQSSRCNSQYGSVNFGPHDTSMFLKQNSLIKTALSKISHLLPSWLSINVWPSTETPSYSIYDYQSLLVPQSQLKHLINCAQPSDENDVLYYVLRTNVPLHIAIDSFNTFLYSTMSPACIVVGLCEANAASIIFNVPTRLQPSMLTNLNYFNRLLSGNGRLDFSTIEMAEDGIQISIDENQKFLNGFASIKPVIPTFEFKVKAEFDKVFIGGNVEVHCSFEGFAFHTSTIDTDEKKIPGVLVGRVGLQITTIVGGSYLPSQELFSNSNGVALFSFPGTSVSRSALISPGVSFKLNYSGKIDLPFSEMSTATLTCPVDGFLSLDEALGINNFTIQSDCLQVSIGQIHLPSAFNHAVHFVNDGGKAVLILSELKLAKASIGNFIHIYANSQHHAALELMYKSQLSSLAGFIRNVNISIFDSEIKTDLFVDDSVMAFNGQTTIFKYFDVDVNGTVSTEYDIDSMRMHVSIEFIDRQNTFKKNLTENLNSHVNIEYNQITEKHANAENRLQNSETTMNELNAILQQIQSDKITLLQSKDYYNESINSLQRLVQELNGTFKTALLAYSNAHGTPSILAEEFCLENECQHISESQSACSSCYSAITVSEQALCNEVVTKQRTVIRYRPVELTSQRYESRCYPCWSLLWYNIPFFSKHNCCFTESVPYLYNSTEPYTITEYYSESRKVACMNKHTQEHMLEMCCEEDGIIYTSPNISCTIEDALCRRIQLENLRELVPTDSDLILHYENYASAKTNLTVSELEYSLVNKRITTLDHEYKLINNIKQNLLLAKAAQKQTKDIISKEAEIFSPLYNNENNIVKPFKIISISSNSVLQTQTPLVMPVQIKLSHDGEIIEMTIVIDFKKSIETLYRQVSNEILLQVLGINQSRRKREAAIVVEDDEFSIICQELFGMESFVYQIADSLNSSFSAFQLNAEHLKQNISSNNIDDFGKLYDSIRKHIEFRNSTLNRFLEILSDFSFLQWQISTDQIYSDVIDVSGNGLECAGLADCLLSVIYDLIIIIEDTRLPEAEHIKQNILSIKNNVVAVGMKPNNTLAEANQSLNALLDIFADLRKLKYWCSEPPRFAEQLPLTLDVPFGETLKLSCNIISNLPVQYIWKRNAIILQSNTNELTINDMDTSDNGEYMCIATNSAGTATSLATQVNVLSAPVLNLTLETSYEVYENYDNGIRFVCDAHSLPVASWKWFYQSKLSATPMEIEDETESTMIIGIPQLSHEGWYTCMAYNEIGNASSNPSFLLVLPAEIASIQYSFEIELSTTDRTSEITGQSIENELRQIIQSTTDIYNFLFTRRNMNSFHISFTLSTSSTLRAMKGRSMEEIMAVVTPSVEELESNRDTLSSVFATSSKFIIIASTDSVSFTTDSSSIGSRQVVCPEGFEVSSNRIICIGCKPGQYSGGKSTELIDLGNGRYMEQVHDQCRACLPGQYQENKANEICLRCPEQHSTSAFGSSSIDECIRVCEPHTFSETGLQPCMPCPLQHYQFEYGQLECYQCSPNDSATIEPCFTSNPTQYTTTAINSVDVTGIIAQPAEGGTGLIILVSAAAGSVLLLLIMVALCMVILLAVLNKRRSKRLQRSTAAATNPSIELNPYDRTGIKVSDDSHYYNCEDKLKLGELPAPSAVNVASLEAIYEPLPEIQGVVPINELPAITAPELPPREQKSTVDHVFAEYSEVGSVKSEYDYMPMNCINPMQGLGDYDEITNIK